MKTAMKKILIHTVRFTRERDNSYARLKLYKCEHNFQVCILTLRNVATEVRESFNCINSAMMYITLKSIDYFKDDYLIETVNEEFLDEYDVFE